MDIMKLIANLKVSELFAVCPCGEEFRIKDAILFDGTKPFPEEALKKQEELKEDLKKREKLARKAAKISN